MKFLAERGFYQSDFHASLFGVPNDLTHDNEAIITRELGEDEFDLYAEIHCLGTGLPISGKDYVAENNKVLYKRNGWKFMLILMNDKPAGVGVMYMNKGIACLTFAATHPEYRNKGIQKALIQARMNEAMKSNCSLIVSQAAYASTSYRNMERSGMRLGYTRTTWTSMNE